MPELVKKVCKHCKGDNVVKDAWASWDVETQSYVLLEVFDQDYCLDCEGDTSIKDEIID